MKFLELFKRQHSPFTTRRVPLVTALEPRMLFDGAVAATAAEATASATDAAQVQNTDDTSHQASETLAPPAAASDQRQEIAFIDNSIANYQQLLDGVKAGTEIVVLDGKQDGLQQIADYLQGRHDIDAIHILSHGSEGQLRLGTATLDNSNLSSRSFELSIIGDSLTADGDILLYGCNLGKGESGTALIGQLAMLTRADIAASTDTTGAAVLGGDWELEFSIGDIEHAVLVSPLAQEEWVSVLGSQYYINIQNGSSSFAISSGVGIGQSFTYNSSDSPNDKINQISIQLKKDSDAASQTIVVQLRSGSWNGSIIDSKTIDYSSLATDFAWRTVNFENTVTMLEGQTYVVRVETTGTDGKVVVGYNNGNIWSNSNLIIAGTANTDLDLKLMVGYNDGNNQPTIVTAPTTVSTNQDTPLVFSTTNGNSISISDADAFPNDVKVILEAVNGNGRITLGQTAGLHFITNSGTDESYMEFRGTVSAINAALTTVTYTPINGFSGTDTLTITATDLGLNGLEVSKEIQIGVNGANNAPVNNVPLATQTINEDTQLVFSAANNNAIQISDHDAGSGQLEVSLSVSNGVLTLGSIAGLTFSTGDGSGDLAMVFRGTLANINTALASVTFAPTAHYHGAAVLTITTNDLGNSGSGGALTDTDTVNITINSVNDAPSGTDNTISLNEDGSHTLVAADFGFSDSNDSPANSLMAVKITSLPTAGSLTLNGIAVTPDQFISVADINDGLLVFTPAANAHGVGYSSFTFQVQDNGGIANGGVDLDPTANTLTFNVTSVNDAPQITAPVSIGVTEDTPSAITGISFSDADAGSANVTVTLSVGSGTLSATSGGGVTVGGTASALTLTGSIANINSFIAGSNLLFTTAINATADVTLTVNINDGGNTGSGGAQNASETITLQVAAVNDWPTISGPVSINVTEDVAKSLAGITFGDVDAGTGSVTVIFSVASGNGTLTGTASSGVTISNSGTNAITLEGTVADINTMISNGRLTYLGALNATGVKTLSISINDDGNTGSGGAGQVNANISLVINAVNDAPVNSVPTAQSVDQDDALVFSSVNGNLISISDVDAGANDVEVTLAATNGLLTLGGTTGLIFTVGSGSNAATMAFSGSIADINNALNGLVFSPTGGYNGPASLQITTNDLGNSGSGGAQTDTDTISITVNSLIPRITDVSASTADGIYKVGDTITITATFSEAVTVDTTGGIPTLLLETGSIDRLATYVSGSGGNTLTFIYTVQPSDLSADLNYQSTAALSLNGAAIRGVTANDAVLTLPSLGDANSLAGNKAIVIDGIAPLVGSVSVPANGTYVAGQDLDFTVNFSEAVVVDTTGGTPRIAVTLDTGGTVFADYVSGSGTSALVFRLTVASGQADSNGIVVGSAIQANGGSLRDAAGNDAVITLNSVGATTGVLVDAADPTVVSVSVPPAGAYAAGSVLTFTVNLSEAVTVDTSGGTPRLLLDIGGHSVYADYVSGSGSSALVFSYTVQSGDTDGDGIDLGNSIQLNGATLKGSSGNDVATALAGIGSTAGVRVDAQDPTAAIVPTGTSPTSANTLEFRVTFNENVTGVDAGDFSLLTGGTVQGTLQSVVQLDARTYQVVVTGVSGSGSLQLALNAPGSGIADAAGNRLGGSVVSSGYEIRQTQPEPEPEPRPQLEGDPEFRAYPPRVVPVEPTPLPHGGTAPSFTSPLLPPPLFEVPTLGGGLPPLGNIFINRGALAPSFIAQVFASSHSDAGGDGSGMGFLGFGGGDAGVFGSSSLSSIFGKDVLQETEQLKIFDGKQWSDGAEGAIFGAPPLSQQLHELREGERRQLHELALALGQIHAEGPKA